MNEQWASIPRHPGYEASTLGRVRSTDRVITFSDGRRRPLSGRVLSQKTLRKGYRGVSLSGVTRTVHQVVLEAFIGPRPEGLLCRHGNNDPADNRLSNLSWGTGTENELDKVRAGTHQQASKTTCPLDHLLIEPNLVPLLLRTKGYRACLSCQRGRARQRYYRETAGITLDLRELTTAYYAEIMDEVVT